MIETLKHLKWYMVVEAAVSLTKWLTDWLIYWLYIGGGNLLITLVGLNRSQNFNKNR